MERMKAQRSVLWLTVGVILALGMMLFVFGSSVYATNSPPKGPTSSLASQSPASWVRHPVLFNGRALHFTQISSSYIKGAPDPLLDGRQIKGDIWELISSNGQILSFHGVYTSLDGKTFYQEIFQNATTKFVRFGDASRPCLQGSSTTSTSTSSLLPAFVDEQALASDHFQMQTSTLKSPYVITSPLANVPSLQDYPASGSIHRWTKTESIPGGFTRTQQEVIGPQQRALVMGSKIIDTTGVVVDSNWTAFGALSLYDPQRIPHTLFSAPQLTGMLQANLTYPILFFP